MARNKATTSSRKKTVTTKSRKGPSAREQISTLIRQAEAELEETREQWTRFTEDGVKKGFKNARKSVLQIKKMAAEIRKLMATITL